MHNDLQIAIDGPVGSGKSLIASELAKRLGITYIYTGAMYRALAFVCGTKGVDVADDSSVSSLMNETTIELGPASPTSIHPCTVFINGKDQTQELFTPKIDSEASLISKHKAVRAFMVLRQQSLAQGKQVVMEGRDIGLRVLPNASLKIYLTATLQERAKRRQAQFETKGIHKSIEEVVVDTQNRDYQDMHRENDPLQKLADAWELDTTQLSSSQVIEAIVAELTKRALL
jgi:cytidylate kinase